MVAVAVAAAAAAADAVVVVGEVEARARCADKERRDEDEEDDDVEDEVDEAGDAAADDRYLDETGLLEREGLRAEVELGLSSAGVSGGRVGWAGSGAVAAVAAATMPSRCRGGAGDLATRGGLAAMQVPSAPGSPPPLPLPLWNPPPLRRWRPGPATGSTMRLPASTRGSSELVKQCYSLRG